MPDHVAAMLHGLELDDGFGDRRKSPRRSLSGFAVIHTLDPDGRKGRYRVAQLRDISTHGIGLHLSATDPESFGEGREFEILFQFSEQGKPLHRACIACRHAVDDVGLSIGATFQAPFASLNGIACRA